MAENTRSTRKADATSATVPAKQDISEATAPAQSLSTGTPEKNNADFNFAEEAKAVEADGGPPMLPGDPKEPVGPEDALGEGPKRGDYSKLMRLESPHEARLTGEAPGGTEPSRVLEPQAQRVEEVGDVAGKKGGVETAGESA